jgi:hypothetical protein
MLFNKDLDTVIPPRQEFRKHRRSQRIVERSSGEVLDARLRGHDVVGHSVYTQLHLIGVSGE